MTKDRKKALFPLIFMSFITLEIYGFIYLRGEWGFLFPSFVFIIGISHYLDKFLRRRFFIYTFSIIISIFIITIIFVRSIRNGSDEKIIIEGKISNVHNSFKYVQFELNEFPDILFKSYNPAVRGSFEKYVLDKNYYDKIPINLGKNATIKVYKSQLEWLRMPFVAPLKSLYFLLELEIISFEIIE
jgi:hypothetical protein